MSALESLRRMVLEQGTDRLTRIGVLASAAWLFLVLIFAWLGPEDQARDLSSWLIWLVGVVLPLALIWFAVWSAHALVALRAEADDLRAALADMRQGGQPERPAAASMASPVSRPLPAAQPLRPSAERRAAIPAPPQRAPSAAPLDTRQARLEFEPPAAPDLTATELFLALNFPDGPEEIAREALRLGANKLPVLSRIVAREDW